VTITYGRIPKLGSTIYINLYGRDEEMFAPITDRPIKQYKRLLENLNHLAGVVEKSPCPIDIGIRTSASFVWEPEPNNKRFMDLITNQQQGKFPEACNHCMFYRSIYRALKKVPTIRYEEYMEIIQERANSN